LTAPDAPAVAWFRKEIVLPDPLPAGRAMLYLGSIERMDTAYINGTQVGASAWVENPRVYPTPDSLLKPGKNIVAIRVLKTKPQALLEGLESSGVNRLLLRELGWRSEWCSRQKSLHAST
jgi:hypothetical protein